MTEDDKFRIELHRSDSYYGDPLAADRIEELLKERDDYAYKLIEANNTYTEMYIEIERLSDTLAKAIKAIKNLKAQWHIRDLQQSDFDAILAELEKP